jgi:hypothetical protein
MDVQDYCEDRGDGPDPDDLHFDMANGPDSVWNKAVLERLLEKLREENDNEFPQRSDAYWINILGDRFTNLRPPWNKGQRRMKPSGELETPEELEERVTQSAQLDKKRDRKATRRQDVSSKIPVAIGAALT